MKRMRVAPALAVLAVALLACKDRAEPAPPRDSVSGLTARGADTLGSQGALASDATLTIELSPALQGALRAAADSFASREAIRVVFTPLCNTRAHSTCHPRAARHSARYHAPDDLSVRSCVA